MWKFISGALLAVLIGVGTFVLMQQLNPSGGGGSFSTTTTPTTAAPTSTAAGATTTTTILQPTEAGIAVVNANNMAKKECKEATDIIADPSSTAELKQSSQVECDIASARLVDAQNAALPQPSMMLSWVHLAISIAMMIFMIIVVVVILRSQPPKAVKSQVAPPRRRTVPKPSVAPVPPTPPSAPKHRRTTSSKGEAWGGQRDFMSWLNSQPPKVQQEVWGEVKNLPDSQKSAWWEAFKASLEAPSDAVV